MTSAGFLVNSHARTGLVRLVFGSAAAIVRRSESPVMVLPRTQQEV